MTALQWIRFISGAVLCLAGLFVTVTGVIGNFRFKYVLLRMHAAGLGDTMGLVLLYAGLAVLSGSVVFALKLLLIVGLFWAASPVASHMIMKMEIENSSSADGHAEKNLSYGGAGKKGGKK